MKSNLRAAGPFVQVAIAVLLMSLDNGFKKEYLEYAALCIVFMMVWDMWRKSP